MKVEVTHAYENPKQTRTLNMSTPNLFALCDARFAIINVRPPEPGTHAYRVIYERFQKACNGGIIFG